MIIWELFVSFFRIGLFSFGGGYAMIPLIEREVVRNQAWLTAQQFIDILAVAEITPGPIAINSATFVGYKMGGLFGGTAATLGVVTPSLLTVMTFAFLFVRFNGAPQLKAALAAVRPVVVVLIFSAAISVGRLTINDIRSAAIAVTVLILMLRTKFNPILLLLAAGLVGIIIF
ncbi:MAG: chromate transporter [Firmicutes bacterium]|nr:chromate transporter [Dethiobacter sp.]MBS3889054.1 chromate transporter [Bacillota bacterium]MBS4053770.1 chromate transporter [Thermaerobacter sp.]